MEIIKALVVVCMLVNVSGHLKGQDRSGIFAESNIVSFPLNGYSASVFFKPLNRKVRFGAEVFCMDMSVLSLGWQPMNRKETMSLQKAEMRISNAVALHAEYFPLNKNPEWFIAGQVSFLRYKVSVTDSKEWSGSLRASTFMAYAGYLYSISGKPVYLKPWIGAGFLKSTNNAGTRVQGNGQMVYVLLGVNAGFHFR